MEVETKPDATDSKPANAAWHAVLVVEGIRTPDRREFAMGSLRWRALPIPLMWQMQTEEKHRGSVVVGRIERIERQDSEIHGWGTFDLGSENGREAHRLVSEQIMRGVSIDAELLEIDREKLMGGEDGEVVLYVEEARIGAATIVSFPAFPQAVIALADSDIPISTEDGRGEALPSVDEADAFIHVDSPHRASISDSPWSIVPSDFNTQQLRNAAAACRGSSDDPTSDCFLLHHEPDGSLSRAGLHTAATAWTQIQAPPAAKARARAHLGAHYRRDLRQDPPPVLMQLGIVAHAEAPGPPASWFADPELKGPTPLTIARNGRVYGHAALWDACHTGYRECMRPPRSRSDYAYFLTGAVFVSDCDCDTPVPTGPIVLGTRHADIYASPQAATAHYDHTGLAVADVAVGEDRFGPWIAGALRPGVTESQIRQLRGSALSGDWRYIGGNLELIAILAVNTPGFPIPRVAAGIDSGLQVSLVAAGIPEDTDPATPDPSNADPTSLLEELKQERKRDAAEGKTQTDENNSDDTADSETEDNPSDQPDTPDRDTSNPDPPPPSSGMSASDLITQLQSSSPIPS